MDDRMNAILESSIITILFGVSFYMVFYYCIIENQEIKWEKIANSFEYQGIDNNNCAATDNILGGLGFVDEFLGLCAPDAEANKKNEIRWVKVQKKCDSDKSLTEKLEEYRQKSQPSTENEAEAFESEQQICEIPNQKKGGSPIFDDDED